MRGVDAVVHTASPAEFGGKEFRESHLKPALEGTRGVLKAIAKEKNVKSVVYTSTFGEFYASVPPLLRSESHHRSHR